MPQPGKLVNRGAAGLLVKPKHVNGQLAAPVGNSFWESSAKDNIRCEGEIADISTLVLDPMNAKKHPERNMAAIKDSLCKHGQTMPLVVRKETRVVMAGNGRLTGALELGWTKLAVSYLSMTDAEAAAYGVDDNRSSENGLWDWKVLASLDKIVSEANGSMVGWSAEELKSLRAMDFSEPQSHEDEVPEPRKIAITQPGDLWLLGPHRLLCGDSRIPEVVVALMNGELASMVWTDPPYGVDYVGKTEDALTIQNDSADGLEDLLTSAWRNAIFVCVDSAPVYCTGPSGDRGEVFLRSFRLAGMVFKQYLIWLKNRMILGRSDYHYRHEPIFYAQTPGAKMGRTVKDRNNWYGQDNATSVFEVDSPSVSKEHPTMKPVELIQMHIENSSRGGEIVLDLFSGSGSTLIACCSTDRLCRGVELDPVYCDVILQRWSKHTGLDPVRESDGVSFKELSSRAFDLFGD